jgi:hypothetical protein
MEMGGFELWLQIPPLVDMSIPYSNTALIR